MKKILSYFKENSFKNLNTEVRGYGYDYSLKKYMIQLFCVFIGLFVIAYYYNLKPMYIFIVFIAAAIMFPIIVRTQFKMLYNNKRFTNLENYMEKMILFFKQQPRILNALINTNQFCDPKTQKVISKMIKIIEESSSTNVYQEAFSLMEKEYPSSRLSTLHRFMITVEETNTTNYISSADNLEYDIHEWVTRTYSYQKQLKDRKGGSYISILFCVVVMAVMAYVYTLIGSIFNYIDTITYQFAATFFIVSALAVYTMIEAKLNSQWLVEDLLILNNDKYKNQLEWIKKFHVRSLLKRIKYVVPFMIIGLYGLFTSQMTLLFIVVSISLLIIFYPLIKVTSLKKKIRKEVTREFPIWLREIVLNYHNYVIVRSIENSLDSCSDVMKPFIEQLIEEIEKDPVSMKPYISFLKEYNIADISTAMMSLYSLQEVSENSTQQINDLIRRNQLMLETTENIRNKNALTGAMAVQFIPIVITLIKLLIDIFSIIMGAFSGVMSNVKF